MIDPLTAEAWLHERDTDCPREGEEIVLTADRHLRTRPSAFPWASVVRWVRWQESLAERGIDEVLAYFAERRRRFVWNVGPMSQPPSLGDRLAARGFIESSPPRRILVARLPIERLRRNAKVRIEEVRDEGGLRESAAFADERWRDEILADRLAYQRCQGRRGGNLLARLGGETAGFGAWTDTADGRCVVLGGGAVAPHLRGRGVYQEIVRWRTERARRRGCEFATLIADPTTSGPILTKRGFADLGPIRIFTSP